jgi:hypothetical protein
VAQEEYYIPVPPVVVVVVSPVLQKSCKESMEEKDIKTTGDTYPLQWLFEFLGKHER